MSIIDDINNLPSTLPLPATRSSPLEWEAEKEQWGEFLNDRTFSILENLLTTFKESSTYLLNNSFKKLDNLTNEDLNTIYGTQNNGFRLQPLTSNATLARNYPINQAGTLITFSTQDTYTSQIYIPYQGNYLFLRTNKISDASTWNAWKSVLFSDNIINDLTTGGSGNVLSAEQGKILNSTKLGITGGTITGSLTINENLTVNNAFNTLKGIKIDGTDTVFIDSSNIMIVGNDTLSGIKLRNKDNTVPSWSDFSTGSEIIKPFALQEDLTPINTNIINLGNKVNSPLKANNTSSTSLIVTSNVSLIAQLSNTSDFTWNINPSSSDPVLNINTLILNNQIKQKTINKQVNKFIVRLSIKFTSAPIKIETLNITFKNDTLGSITKTIILPMSQSELVTEIEFNTITTSTDGYNLEFYSSVDIPELKITEIIRI